MEYRVLGEVAAVRDGTVLDLGGRARALLALLLTEANRVVSTDRIIDELWDDTGQDRQNALWVVISRLRGLLDPDRPKRTDGAILVTRPPGYMLVVEPDTVDAMRFEALVHEGRALADTDPAAASLVLTEALALWRGHAYEEFTYEPFAEAEIARLTELRLATLEDRVDTDLACGRCRDLVSELESLVRQHPRRERLATQLMVALHQSGRQSDALRAFATYRTHLADELGLDPSATIVELERRIARDDPSLRPTEPIDERGRAAPGLTVRGYELRELIGSGATGNVFTAYQPAVGRQVAIKVVRSDLADDPDFIRRFDAEARRVAGIEHPQVVPIYDYWREAGSAYLVMRRFAGGDLGSLLDDQPELPLERRRQIVEQIGGALAAAHDRGIVHGDVRPANILIGDHGDAYLADFGLSYDITTSERGAAGYMAPEQLDSGVPSIGSDVFALAALTDRLLGEAADDRLRDVIERGRASDPSGRPDDAGAFVRAYEIALGRAPATTASDHAPNPYRGLEAFHEATEASFFGRERLVERLVARIGATGTAGRFVALVGPSGSGKSSVVRAGLIPALRRGAAPGSERWFVATTVPGRHPFTALADALLAIAVDPPTDLVDQLRTKGIAPTVRPLLADPGAQLLLVVDQLEELFVQSDPGEAHEFLSAIVDAVEDRHSAVRVVATLRADFYDEPLRHPDFGELMRLGTDAITPLNPSELERAIARPAERVGVTVDAAVVAAVAADMVGQPTALPLMQFALTELFERRTGPSITIGDYERLGGLASALALRADAVLDALDPARRADARHIFLRLVTLSDGAADTRRRAGLSELSGATDGNPGQVLDPFVARRLLSVDRDPVTRGPTVEIAHEALLTEWATLRDWIDDARGDVRQHRRLAESAAEWHASDQSADFLLGGDQLAVYGGWTGESPVRLTSDEFAYLDASRTRADSELMAERRRSRRLQRLVAGVAAALVLALVAGGIAVWQQNRAADARDEARSQEAVAVEQRSIALEQTEVAQQQQAAADQQRNIAEQQRNIAEQQTEVAQEQTVAAEAAAQTADLERMRAQAVAETERNPPLAALLAVEAYNVDRSHLNAGAIQQVLTGVDGRQATLFDTAADYGGRGVISADGSIVATSSSNGVDVWDVDERALRLRLDEEFATFDMSADGSALAVYSPDSGGVDLYDLATLEHTATIEQFNCDATRNGIRLGSGGRMLLNRGEVFGCTTGPNTLEVWDVGDLTEPRLEWTHTASDIRASWWAPDGTGYVTVAADGSVVWWDALTHEPRWTYQFDLEVWSTFDGEPTPLEALFTSDGGQVVVATGFNQNSSIWLFTFDAATGTLVREPTPTAPLGSMSWWDADETQVVGTLWPSGATVLDLALAEEVLPPPIVNPNATAVWVDRDRGRTVAASFVGIEIFSIDGTSVLERRVPLTPEQLAINAEAGGQVFGSMTADGERALVGPIDFTQRAPLVEWDLTTPVPTIVAEHPTAIAYAQGDATLLLSLAGVTMIDGDHRPFGSHTPLGLERGAPSGWRSSSDGSRHGPLRDGSGAVEVYETATGELLPPPVPPGIDIGPNSGVFATQHSFSHDGDRLIVVYSTSDGPLWVVYDLTTSETIHSGGPERFESPWLAGETLYANPPDSFDLERRDIETLEITGPPLIGHTLLLNAIIDDLDSDRIVTQATNGNVRVWDRATGDQIGSEIAIGRQSAGTDLFAARDGDLVGVILDTGVAIWNYDIDTWPALACAIAGRNMTRSEWDDFGPQGEPYRPTCPQFP